MASAFGYYWNLLDLSHKLLIEENDGKILGIFQQQPKMIFDHEVDVFCFISHICCVESTLG